MGAAAAGGAARRRRPGGPPGLARVRDLPSVIGRLATADRLLAGAVAALLCLLAFAAEGGVAIEPNTFAQVGLLALGAGLGAAALAAPARFARVQPFHGAGALAGLAALTVLTTLSIVWSLAPADSWLDANRMLSLLAALGGGIALVRLSAHRWGAVLGGLAIASLVVSSWALLTKVLPGVLAEEELFARLRAPFGYWNAVGLMAALGVPPLLWLAARRSGHAALGALAYPGLGLLLVTVLLAYSRGALLALGAGLVLWFAIVPLRLRSALALLTSGAAAALVVTWAFAQDGLTEDGVALPLRTDAGHELGVLLALMVVVLLGAGLAAGFLASYRPPSERARRLAGRALVTLLAGAAAFSLATLAMSEGGIDGQLSKAFNELVDPDAAPPDNAPERLTATSSVRSRYWREALDVHAERPWLGAGAAAYATARTRHRQSALDVEHAHGYVVQTLADLGWVGLLLSLAAAGAWLFAAARTLGLRPSDRGLPWDAERVGLCALATVVVVFAVHSTVDWTWYVPATAVAALLAAGWVAGRGPLRERLDDEGSVPRGGHRPHAGLPLKARMRAWRPDPYRTGLAAGVLIIAMTAAWTVVQPLRAVNAGAASLARLEIGAHDAAADIARIAHERDPLSVEPYFELAAAHTAAGRLPAAHAALEDAVELQPANSEAWRRLGRFRLSVLGDPEAALEAFRAAYYLDPQGVEANSDVLEASRALQLGP